MRATLYFWILLIIGCTGANRAEADTSWIGQTPVLIDTVYFGLDVPWEILYVENGQLLITERKGLVNRLDVESGELKQLLDLRAEVYAAGESGLLGMALHPDFPGTPEVFIVYTYRENTTIKERLVKYRLENDSLVQEQVLIDNIPGNTNHIGSRLHFLPDKTLLMSTGDALNKNASQDSNALNGKIIRCTVDGSIPSNNPWSSYIYALGLRNVQGMAKGPGGFLYISEHGPTTDDEFQKLEKGKNYGWPLVEGYCDKAQELSYCSTMDITEPLIAWTPTLAPSDLMFYEHPAIPEWNNKMLMAVLKNKMILAIELDMNGDTVLSQTPYFSGQFGRIRDIVQGQNGTVFLATNGPDWGNSQPNTHCIVRIRPANATNSIGAAHNRSAEMSIYPNPVSKQLNIRLEPDIHLFRAHILDAAGRIVETGLEKEITLRNLVPGMYSIEAHTSRGILRKKFIIKAD